MSVNFREKAKEKLNASENLDLPIGRIRSHWRLAAAGGIVAVAGFLLWAFLGEIPISVQGNGIYQKEKGEVLCFVSLEDRAEVEEGMQVRLQTDGSMQSYLYGYIREEEDFWDSREKMLEYVNGDEALLSFLTKENPTAVYRCVLEDSKEEIKDGTLFLAQIQKDPIHPVELWL